MSKWVMAHQTPWNSVKYITDDLTEYTTKTYTNFLSMILALNPLDPNGLKEALDSFETIFLDCDIHTWRIEKYVPEVETFTQKEMHEFNPSEEIIEAQKKESILDRTKDFIETLHKFKIEKNINKFKDKEKTYNGITDRNRKGY